ncbi:hypothetical protein E0Z10_g1477 [Xylaria hypoxylon]|uniref:Uncharacterized protein n=1 Tax=Xylaria hypoxylon TaxID=37992 RepID=A0A4Z0YTB9_9PEZI|nr:hypothetical protein E0Z10_g1477 [Xylaria hypoxylon]
MLPPYLFNHGLRWPFQSGETVLAHDSQEECILAATRTAVAISTVFFTKRHKFWDFVVWMAVGRQRASSMSLQGRSPIRSPIIMPSERVPPLSDGVDEPNESTSFGAARNPMNYQSTQTTSSLRSRQPVQPEANPASHNGSAAHDAEEKKHWLWDSLDGIWSFELENKGSVARDHLAVGMFDNFPYLLVQALEIVGLT